MKNRYYQRHSGALLPWDLRRRTADAGSKVAWASSEVEVKALKAAGKLIICPRLEWLPAGAAIAILEEGGKPQIYLQMCHINDSGVVVSDSGPGSTNRSAKKL